jgi:glycosyltransferase involved in cell wall biosynthesis
VFLTVHDSGVVIKFPQLFRSIISISESVRNDLINRQAIASTVVLNGVDINLFRRKRKLKESSFENFKIVQVSRLRHTKKGQHLLLFAIKILRQLGLKNISVDFIGEGPSLYLLKELVSELGIESQVNFLGLQSREFIADHLCDYDLLIQPSFYEGFGLTIVEAFSARVPVLVSNIEGPNEIINNGEFGFSFESGDVDDLVAKIQYIHSNIDLASFKSDLAYNTRLSDFDINTTAQKYLSIYNYA